MGVGKWLPSCVFKISQVLESVTLYLLSVSSERARSASRERSEMGEFSLRLQSIILLGYVCLDGVSELNNSWLDGDEPFLQPWESLPEEDNDRNPPYMRSLY